jgi:hypothetical protein
MLKEVKWKHIDDLIESIKNTGLQADFVNNTTVKLTGQNIDEVRLH